MKSIMMTYRDFRLLPKGLKQLLLASESFFFEEAISPIAQVDTNRSLLPTQSMAWIPAARLQHSAWRS